MKGMDNEIERLREELHEAQVELQRVHERRGDMDARIAYFGPMHGESVRRLQITTEADGDILSVAEQEHHKGRRLLWLEVMRIRGSYGGHDLCSLYLTPSEAEELRDLLTAYVEAARSATPSSGSAVEPCDHDDDPFFAKDHVEDEGKGKRWVAKRWIVSQRNGTTPCGPFSRRSRTRSRPG